MKICHPNVVYINIRVRADAEHKIFIERISYNIVIGNGGAAARDERCDGRLTLAGGLPREQRPINVEVSVV